MTLPTFLGIGVPRAGTTWLHALLASHPAVYLPTRRKEVRFFDRHYERGLAWYEDFFCPSGEADRYGAIGEISPQYLYCGECPDRIAGVLPDARLLLMLRHPVDRAYSNYGFTVQRGNYRGSFDEFIAARPDVLDRGYYSGHLKRYLGRFGRDRIQPLVFEDAMRDREAAQRAIAGFLDVRADGFTTVVGRVNPSSVPRFPTLSGVAVKAGRRLRRRNLEGVVDLVGRLGFRRAMTSGKALPPLDPEVRRSLGTAFGEEIDELERCLQIDLSGWRV